MAQYFPLILVLATFITGFIWLMDKVRWMPQRQNKLLQAEEAAGGTIGDEARELILKEPSWIENGKSVFPVIAIVMVLRSFIYEPFQIPSGSMMPTLLVGDFILVEKFSYSLREPVSRTQLLKTGEVERGDVAVFKFPLDTRIDYIKRIIGLPGDRIIYQNKRIYIEQACSGSNCPGPKALVREFENDDQFSNGPFAMEQYSEVLGDVKHSLLISPSTPDRFARYYNQAGTKINEWIVPEGHYFAMGDNRDNSQDSRFWGFVPEDNLVGKAVGIWVSFEFGMGPNSFFSWVPTGIRFNRIGGII
ncbi:signal peptidase I [Alginatibacterium sediminis]|uniref:Signal peptidase I n=1 Tax=Alginatibacterium sediminis TaxID=2164068 RepID=A0A420ED58_9ALTE|nr:signal peptidase I [Alginatibacterium sediminis]RKF18605.1 signal peptidase I [Alginatibacterium sediminis]